MNPSLEVMTKVLGLIEDHNLEDDEAAIAHIGDGMWRIKSAHQNKSMNIFIYLESNNLMVSVYGMSKFFDVDTVGDCENYIQYCAEYVILEIIRFLDEWKK